MRYLIVLLIIVFGSCKSNKELPFKDQLCLNDGVCTYQITPNQVMSYNYNNLKEFYPTNLVGKNLVFKYEYKRKEIPNVQDGNYREEVFIEIDKDNIELETEDLKSQKIVFARWCYCKGQTGYYKVNSGNLKIKKVKGNSYKLTLDFKVKEVPQVVSKIQYIFELE